MPSIKIPLEEQAEAQPKAASCWTWLHWSPGSAQCLLTNEICQRALRSERTRHSAQTCWNFWNCATALDLLLFTEAMSHLEHKSLPVTGWSKNAQLAQLFGRLISLIWTTSYHFFMILVSLPKDISLTRFYARRWSVSKGWISSWHRQKNSSGCIPNTVMPYVKYICNVWWHCNNAWKRIFVLAVNLSITLWFKTALLSALRHSPKSIEKFIYKTITCKCKSRSTRAKLQRTWGK